jgi:hypothetical protein
MPETVRCGYCEEEFVPPSKDIFACKHCCLDNRETSQRYWWVLDKHPHLDETPELIRANWPSDEVWKAYVDALYSKSK